MFRYLEVARPRFRTLLLAPNAEECKAEERKVQRDRGKPEVSQIDHLIECDTANVEAMLTALEPVRTQVAGVLAGDDHFVPVTAQLGRRLGFPYAADEDAIAQQRKSAMKRRLAAHGVRTPPFHVVTSFAEAHGAWQGYGRDAVVKMVDYFGSLNVSRVRTELELRTAWDNIMDNEYAPSTPFPLAREALVEAFMPGRELSVEGYTQEDRCVILNFNDKITDPQFIVIGHYLPAQVPPEELTALKEIAEKCVGALGMRNTVFHIEVNLVDGLPYVIESASRPPGQYMVDLMERSYGLDLMDISVRLAAGERVETLPRAPRKHYAMLAIFAEQSGVFIDMDNWEEFLSRPGVLRTCLDIRAGEPVVKLETFQNRYGFVMLEDETAEGVRELAAWFRANVRMNVAEV
jgi:formate-dependent phosphoribosylglycinamide formyltransferase (GAR transformylase)